MSSSTKVPNHSTSTAGSTRVRMATAGCAFLFATLLLPAFPLVAQQASLVPALPGCGAASPPEHTLLGAPLTERPLAPEERLFYRLPDVAGGFAELSYFVDGILHLHETIDLSVAEVPLITEPDPQWFDKEERFLDARRLLEGDRVFELLVLRPDLVRKLARIAADGSMVELEVSFQGVLVDRLTFEELLLQSAGFPSSHALPLVVRSTVGGPGALREPRQPILAKSSYPDCPSICTETTPCDTDCGWDEGKGGPVTCAEQGLPCQPADCACEYSPTHYWTGWYDYGYWPTSPPSWTCHYVGFSDKKWHRLYAHLERRDLVERKTVCPNCPSCSGCHVQETVVDYQLRIVRYCRIPDFFLDCEFATTACCSTKCPPFQPCNSGC